MRRYKRLEQISDATIIGSPEHCRKQLAACWAAGMHMSRISVLEPDLKKAYRTMEVLAPTTAKL